jgi:hypothetical protein
MPYVGCYSARFRFGLVSLFVSKFYLLFSVYIGVTTVTVALLLAVCRVGYARVYAWFPSVHAVHVQINAGVSHLQNVWLFCINCIWYVYKMSVFHTLQFQFSLQSKRIRAIVLPLLLPFARSIQSISFPSYISVWIVINTFEGIPCQFSLCFILDKRIEKG